MFSMSQNVKNKTFSVTALSLCYPINEEVTWLWRWFVGEESTEARE
jgi:hypothetical protein